VLHVRAAAEISQNDSSWITGNLDLMSSLLTARTHSYALRRVPDGCPLESNQNQRTVGTRFSATCRAPQPFHRNTGIASNLTWCS
jgi:hypothetical protein